MFNFLDGISDDEVDYIQRSYVRLVINQERQRYGYSKIDDEEELICDFVANEIIRVTAVMFETKDIIGRTFTNRELVVFFLMTQLLTFSICRYMGIEREKTFTITDNTIYTTIDKFLKVNITNHELKAVSVQTEDFFELLKTRYRPKELFEVVFEICRDRIDEIDKNDGSIAAQKKLFGFATFLMKKHTELYINS